MPQNVAPDPRTAFFDHHAATWDATGPPAAATLARLEALRPHLCLRPGSDLLEVGCGTGQVSGWLADQIRPGRLTALDFSPAMIDRARRRGVRAEFRCADICLGTPAASAYDVAFCLHTFPHFRDQPAAVRNLAAALRPRGRLIVLHLDNWRAVNAFHDSLGPPVAGDHLPAPADWGPLLAAAGLELTALRDEQDLFLVTAWRPAG